MDDYARENNKWNTTYLSNNYRDIKFLVIFPLSISKEKATVDLYICIVTNKRKRITQVISNLLNNAFKFTNKGNTINIVLIKKAQISSKDIKVSCQLIRVSALILRYFILH